MIYFRMPRSGALHGLGVLLGNPVRCTLPQAPLRGVELIQDPLKRHQAVCLWET